MRAHLNLYCVASLAFAAGLPAQRESTGIFPGVAAATSIDGGGFASNDVYIKKAGFTTKRPTSWSAANPGPSFDLAAILAACGGGANIDVNALSIGQDIVQANPATGEVMIPGNQWAALTVSVSKGSTGTPGSVIHQEANAPDGVCSDIISHILPGSALPPEFVGRTDRAHDSIEMGIDGSLVEVDAMDHFIPIYTLEQGMRDLMPNETSIFFSVSSASLALVPGSWWGGTAPSAATIFRLLKPSPTAPWLCPVPFLTYDAIGLGVTEDIDGLGLDLRRTHMLFSTKTASRNEILYFDYAADFAEILPYANPETGTPITDDIGLSFSDDVDAICAMDPTIRATGVAFGNPFFYLMGIPDAPILPWRPALNASSFRTFDAGKIYYETYVSGWGPATGAVPGFVLLTVTAPSSASPIFQISPAIARDPLAVFGGDPKSYRFEIPPPFSLGTPPIELTLRWFGADNGGAELSHAWGSLVRL